MDRGDHSGAARDRPGWRLGDVGLSEVYLVGTSGGALAAINAALEYPQLARAVAADSFAGISADPAVTKEIQAGRAQAKQIEGVRSYLQSIHGEDWEQVFDADTDAVVRHAREIGAYFHRPLSELQVPLLLTGSEEDEMFPAGHYQRLFREICQETNRAEAHLFPHGGHPAMMSNMEEFSALLDRLIEI
ncbi:MAG: alpha/beta fold hydrolase [Clostridia bacterium]|nr:alpha/beta fold hydrolase [Clostridia bacterium]